MTRTDKGPLGVTTESVEVGGACADDLMPHVPDDSLVVLRSTVYPGTTD